MIITFIALLIASLLASGVLFKHDRLLTYLAAAGILLEAQWLLLTLFQRTIFSSLPISRVMDIGAVILLILWAPLWKYWKLSWRLTAWHIKKDAAVMVVMIIGMASLMFIASYNGYLGKEWISHGFYNGDTVTLASLVQRSLLTKSLVKENPFAGNGALEYPTLVHAGLANTVSAIPNHSEWLAWLFAMSLIQLVLIVPIFFLVWDTLIPEPADDWMLWHGLRSWRLVLVMQAGVIAFVMGLSWDSFVYPQSHFFIIGIYILLAALLWKVFYQSGLLQWVSVATAFAMALVLLFSNAISGSAAIAITVIFYIMRAFDHKRTPVERGIFLALIPVWGVLYKLFTPGNGAFGMPHLSATAGLDMMKLAPVIVVLVMALFWYFAQKPNIAASVSVLIAMALVAYIFSTRNIVAENASRFFYHAILIAFPMLAYPLIRTIFWLKRELINTSRSVPEMTAGWLLAITTAVIFFIPVGTSVVSAHNNLIKHDTQKTEMAMLTVMDWIRDKTKPTDIILAPPDEPWNVPLFTGRALLRTNYWLSPDDSLGEKVTLAFKGDQDAQKIALGQSQYVILTNDQQLRWDLKSLKRVFGTGDVTIYTKK